MQIWPAIDLRGGKCVRLQQGDYARETVFGDDPVAMAVRWQDEGAQQLHLVDLDGARDGAGANREAVAAIVAALRIPCQLGGGVRDEASIQQLQEMGISRLVIGTKAVKEPAWLRAMAFQYPHRLVLGIDARNGQVATDGWLETSGTSAIEFALSLQDLPLAGIVYTDIAKDGMLAGPNLSAMREMKEAVALEVIASGGVSGIQDVAALSQIGLDGCIIGRALYEQRLTLPEALAAAGA